MTICSLKCDTILICLHVPAQEDLTVILLLHYFYNADMISIYVIKISSQTMSPLCIETKKRCVPNLNKEHTGKPIEKCALDLSADITAIAIS